ncbi:PEP-CTERM sorting domain-containing protein [Colwellia hornerae]|uniref:PEP-CTERM sorting domain-containing protein n=1 Tax=Colwellia hornerae TaxID=89402 RepID=A0A5C6QL20_9GAMM|nr:PEP-CTERM sorting domain-containing protein [Colwellia hornerae]TWX58620.1 PEP-CTERM sorting domain-containing protein [Colwellia hornerae]TWX59686.1 PEP-CTERM sorting domain-containing protein [Colwellia hornerae]TWX69413.1 PEP-CTERM sorting domain-containing protein [Colwellia hornerae]
MRFTFNKYLAITVTLFCFSNVSFASKIITCESKSNNGTATFDYGDATQTTTGINYGVACHDTNNWQQLGKAKIKDDNGDNVEIALEGESDETDDDASKNLGWNAETSNKDKDSGDNGVRWRVQNSDGTWPSKFSRGALTAGANVEYKFIVTRSNEGNHEYDQLKAWSDWNGDGKFDESEIIINETWYKNHDKNGTKNENGSSNSDLMTKNNTDTRRIYKEIITIPAINVANDTWMRARIICENSLVAGNDFTLSSTGYYHQGEVEDYKVAINTLSAVQVPEPTTLFVFGSALIGLVLSRKKTR